MDAGIKGRALQETVKLTSSFSSGPSSLNFKSLMLYSTLDSQWLPVAGRLPAIAGVLMATKRQGLTSLSASTDKLHRSGFTSHVTVSSKAE